MENKIDNTALFSLSYGLYVITSNDGKKDNGMICNTACQVASTPTTISVSVNKANYSAEIIKKTGKMNVNCLSTSTRFETFVRYGFQSDRDANKLDGVAYARSQNGLVVLVEDVTAFISLKVVKTLDLNSHYLFLCEIEEAKTFSKAEPLTYAYYHKNVKPKPKTEDKTANKDENKEKGWRCTICGYVYPHDDIPDDFICPLCKHPRSDFEKIN